MKNKLKIVSIIVTWNSKKFVSKAIESLNKSDYPTTILVVDNKSADGTEKYIKEKYPSVNVIQSGANKGFAGANNIAIKKAIEEKADYVFLLNPDAYIHSNCIKELINVMESDLKIGMVCPKIYYHKEKNRIWFAGSVINWETGETPHLGGDKIDNGEYAVNTLMDRVCGCAVLIRTDALKKVGLMDESYFLYFEETDLSVRFTKKKYKLLFVANAICWHDASLSTGGMYGRLYQYYMTRNNLYFIKKYGNKNFNKFLIFFFKRKIIILLIILKNKPKIFIDILLLNIKGVFDFYFKRFGKGI